MEDSQVRATTVPMVHPEASGADHAQAKSPRFRRALQVGVALGVASGVAVGAAALASAATSPTTPPSSATAPTTPKAPSAPHMGGKGGFGFAGRGFGGAGFGGAAFGFGPVLHGEATIKGPNGYETIEVQSGTVTSLKNTSGSTWSLVVTSADKTLLTYTVSSGSSVNGGETGIASVKTGDKVSIVAVVSKGTATVKSLIDTTRLQANGSSWMPGRQGPSSSSGGSAPSGTSTN